MTPRRALAAVLAALCLGACAAATPAPTTGPAPALDGASTPAAVLEQAREVADQLEQRQAELETMVP